MFESQLESVRNMPSTKILFALLLCSLIFIGLFLPSLIGALKLLIGHISVIGGGSTPYTPLEILLFWISVAGIILSFLIHPYGAYLMRDYISQLTSSAALQTLIFVMFAGFQLALIASAYGVALAKKQLAIQQQIKAGRAHQEIVTMLDNANIDVIAKDARVIADDGRFVLAEVTFEIKNVPLSLPRYEMNIHDIGQAEQFFTGFVRGSNYSIPNPALRVTSRGGKWVFYDIFSKQTVSDDAQNVKLQFEFSRVKAPGDEMPETITPRLGIWARDDKLYYRDYLFFYKPIPVKFERLRN